MKHKIANSLMLLLTPTFLLAQSSSEQRREKLNNIKQQLEQRRQLIKESTELEKATKAALNEEMKSITNQEFLEDLEKSNKTQMEKLGSDVRESVTKSIKEAPIVVMVPQCVPPREVIPFPANMNRGQYYRFSPDGDKVIVSSGSIQGHRNSIGLIHIQKDKDGKEVAKSIPTLMYDETYPVEGMKNKNGKYEWKILTSPFDPRDSGMLFYEINTDRENDVLKNGENASHIFNDPQHDQWYHSAASAPTASGDTSNFKVMLWSDQRMKDYKMSKNPDGSTKIEATSQQYRPCTNLETISGPIISKDASMVAFSQNYSTVIYKFNDDKTCDLVRNLNYSTGKVSFNYPDQEPVVAFNTDVTNEVDGNYRRYQAVQIFNYGDDSLDDNERTKNITDPKLDYSQGYAGMLADGRVMYITQRTSIDEDGFEDTQTFIVRADPKQLNNDGTVNLEAAKKNKCTKSLQPLKVNKKKTNQNNSSGAISQ